MLEISNRDLEQIQTTLEQATHCVNKLVTVVEAMWKGLDTTTECDKEFSCPVQADNDHYKLARRLCTELDICKEHFVYNGEGDNL